MKIQDIITQNRLEKYTEIFEELSSWYYNGDDYQNEKYIDFMNVCIQKAENEEIRNGYLQMHMLFSYIILCYKKDVKSITVGDFLDMIEENTKLELDKLGIQ